jgi:hypothetical protein
VSALDDCLTAQDFVGIKIGDINGSAQANFGGLQEGDERGRQENSWPLLMEDTEMRLGQTYSLSILAPKIADVSGFQFTLDFPTDQLELIAVEEGLLKTENLGQVLRERGQLTVAWARTLDDEEQTTLFTLIVKAKVSGRVADLVQLSSSYVRAEAYERNNEDEQLEIKLGYFETIGSGLALYQNIPNPVTAQTIIPFELPQNGNAIIEIYTAKGRRVLTISDGFTAGTNEIKINRGQLSPGVYVYTLRFGELQLSRKMIIMD